MTPNAIYSKSGKGVQEASGKTSLLSRGDRAVLSAFDGRLTISDVADRVGKAYDAKFQQLIVQLEREGYIREVSAGGAPAKPSAPARPAAAAAKPAPAAPAAAPGPDLDFTIAIPASPPPRPKVAAAPQMDSASKARAETEKKAQEDNMARARREAEEKAQKERDRVKTEAEAKIRAETEAKMRTEAADKMKADAEAKVRAESEAKVKAARDAAVRIAAEAKAKAEAEMQAKLDAERAKIKEEAEKARREAEELRQRLEEEQRKAREAEERRRREDEEKRRKEEEERRVREEQERAVREMQEAEAERAVAERAEREAKEKEKISAAAAVPTPAPAPASDGGFGDLMADLDSFSNRDAAEKKAKDDAERKDKDEKKARKASEEAERKAKDEADKARKESEEKAEKEERRRKEEEAKRAKEEEAERARQEAEDRKRREREAELMAVRAAAASKSDDIGVSDDDLDMDDIKADQEAVSKESRKAQREREREAKEREREAKDRAKEREREAKRAAKGGSAAPAPAAYKPFRRRRSWGKPVAIFLFILLAAGVGALHVMPISTAEYEKAASDAIGRPVKIAAAHVSLLSGVELKLDGVSVGATKIASVRAFPEIGSLLDERKAFTRIELDGVSVEQRAIGEVLAATLRGRNFAVGRLNVKRITLTGPLPLPVLEAELLVGPTGSISVISVQGPDNLVGKFTPTATGVDFDITASGFTLPFMPDVTLSTFAMKGRANGDSARIESWGGAYLDGAFSGSANLRWSSGWNLDGVMTGRGINAAVFAPALLSEGKAEGTARFSMSDAEPTNFKTKGRVEGSFSLNKGVLGSFDLSRAILTGGRQATGRTPFTEMNGQAVFDRGAIALRNVSFGAGAMNAAASADITPEGALSGRIIADIRTSSQNLRATVNIGGTVTEPLVK
jgi:hypothetical protein